MMIVRLKRPLDWLSSAGDMLCSEVKPENMMLFGVAVFWQKSMSFHVEAWKTLCLLKQHLQTVLLNVVELFLHVHLIDLIHMISLIFLVAMTKVSAFRAELKLGDFGWAAIAAPEGKVSKPPPTGRAAWSAWWCNTWGLELSQKLEPLNSFTTSTS